MSVLSSILTLTGNLNMVTGNVEQAEKHYRGAVDRRAKSGLPYLNLAVLSLQRGDIAGAKTLLTNGLALRKIKPITDKGLLVTMGACLWLEGDLNGAIEVLERLRRKYAYMNPSALTTLGYVYMLNNDFENALAATNAALADDANYASAWDNLGQIRYRQGDLKGAKEAFSKAVELKELPDSLYFLGEIAELEGDAESAKTCYERAANVRITPLNTITAEQVSAKLKALTAETES